MEYPSKEGMRWDKDQTAASADRLQTGIGLHWSIIDQFNRR